MMKRNQLLRVSLGSLVLAAVAGPAVSRANVVIGDWEGGSTDGWIDWNSQQPVGASNTSSLSYSWSTDTGVTHGASSLHVYQTGWSQSLSIKLQSVGHKADFFANKQLMIDVSVPGGTTPGWAEIWGVWLNSPNGFNQISTQNPVYQFGWGSGGPTQNRTKTLVFDYSALVDGNTGNGEIDPSAGWVEFIFAPNDDGSHPDFYFDNARLMTPGDVNSDGKINADDYALIDRGRARYAAGAIPANGATWTDGDFNADGVVDSADYLLMDKNYAHSVGLSPDLLAERQGQFGDAYVGELVAAVPEPGVGALLLVGSAALVGRRRGRHAAH